MTTGLLLRPRLVSALSQAIDWGRGGAATGSAPVLLAAPPLRVPAGVGVTYHAGAPLRETRATRQTGSNQPYFLLHRWKRQRLHSIRFPYLACLLEGEMDWRIGLTERVAKSLSGPEAGCSQVTLALRAGQFFLMPPGVPYSTGAQIHWERPEPAQANYKVLWMHMLPTGTFCHLSGAQGGKQLYEPPVYVHDSRVHLMAEFLREEMEGRAADFESIAKSQLLSLLARVRRELQQQYASLQPLPNQELRHESAQQAITGLAADTSATAVQQACAYIEAHLHAALQLQPIARQVFVSSSYLNRMFRREMGSSVMDYVIRRRVEIAQALLQHSTLPVHEIGRHVGYPNPSHFSQIFLKKTGHTPAAFRALRGRPKGAAVNNESKS